MLLIEQKPLSVQTQLNYILLCHSTCVDLSMPSSRSHVVYKTYCVCIYIYIYSVGPLYIWGRDSVVGIETRGWTVLEGTRPDRPGAHPASYTMGTGSFPGVKRPGRGVDHPLHLAPRLKKERVELYLYSPSGSSCSVLG